RRRRHADDRQPAGRRNAALRAAPVHGLRRDAARRARGGPRMRRLGTLLMSIALLAMAAAGCGSTTVVKESPVVVTGGSTPIVAGGPASGGVRIAVVTHGQ